MGSTPIRASICPKVLRESGTAVCARMVESVDTRDLKSLDHNGRAGSSPALRTIEYESLLESIQTHLDPVSGVFLIGLVRVFA